MKKFVYYIYKIRLIVQNVFREMTDKIHWKNYYQLDNGSESPVKRYNKNWQLNLCGRLEGVGFDFATDYFYFF